MSLTAIFQLFDRQGKAQLPGTSPIKDRSDWLWLNSFGYTLDKDGKATNYFFVAGDDDSAAAKALILACAKGGDFERALLRLYTDEGEAYKWLAQVEFRKASVDSIQKNQATYQVAIKFSERVVVYQDNKAVVSELSSTNPDDWSLDATSDSTATAYA